MCKTCCCGSEAGNEQISVIIKGIKTSGCVKIIKRSLLGLPGVLHVHVHAHDGQTKIAYNPVRTTIEDIANQLKSEGYYLQSNV